MNEILGIFSLMSGGALALYMWFLIFKDMRFAPDISTNIGKIYFGGIELSKIRLFYAKGKHYIKGWVGITILLMTIALLATGRYLTLANPAPYSDMLSLSGAACLIIFVVFSAVISGYLAQRLKDDIEKVPASTMGIDAPEPGIAKEKKGPGDFLASLIGKILLTIFIASLMIILLYAWYLTWFVHIVS